MTLEESFEPVVMFFGLTNSLAIFQTIISEILQDLINNEEVASFIDNIIVEQKKYKWKIRKVGFLEVVIGLERIKMEEEKIKGVLYLPTTKEIKDIQKFLGLASYYW